MSADKKELHVMVDLETVGTSHCSGILAIGAVVFDHSSLIKGEHSFYEKASFSSLEKSGFTIDQDTLNWWGKQELIAKREAFSGTKHIREVLLEFTGWIKKEKEIAKATSIILWGNGADFDNALLVDAYDLLDLPVPWSFRNNRCYRTLKNLFPAIKQEEFIGTKHNALHDAINQAQHAGKLLTVIQGFN